MSNDDDAGKTLVKYTVAFIKGILATGASNAVVTLEQKIKQLEQERADLLDSVPRKLDIESRLEIIRVGLMRLNAELAEVKNKRPKFEEVVEKRDRFLEDWRDKNK